MNDFIGNDLCTEIIAQHKEETPDSQESHSVVPSPTNCNVVNNT